MAGGASARKIARQTQHLRYAATPDHAVPHPVRQDSDGHAHDVRNGLIALGDSDDDNGVAEWVGVPWIPFAGVGKLQPP